MTPVMKPRSLWYSGVPIGTSQPRPTMNNANVNGIDAHYHGGRIRTNTINRDVVDYMTDMEQRDRQDGDPFGYNYVIPPRPPGVREVWEYSGTYQAAHAGPTINPKWFGVQFAIGVNNPPGPGHDPNKLTVWEPITDDMIVCFQWLRDVHLPSKGYPIDRTVYDGMLRATQCPGESVKARFNDLLEPYNPTEVPSVEAKLSFFRFSDVTPTPLYVTSNGVHASYVTQDQAKRLSIGEIRTYPKETAKGFTLIGGICPPEHVGWWANG